VKVDLDDNEVNVLRLIRDGQAGYSRCDRVLDGCDDRVEGIMVGLMGTVLMNRRHPKLVAEQSSSLVHLSTNSRMVHILRRQD
jgi:hypothetical protein